MEEKVLLPAARAARGGAALAVARLLRTDHGAIAALLVPTPTPEVLERILSVLGPHNALEEEPDGLYETCDRLLADEAAALLEKLRAFPEVPMAPHQDSPLVEKHIAETLALARKARASDERVFRAETLRATGEDPLAATSYEPGARRRRDPEDRRLSRADYEGRREKMFDKTVADSFPASDPPSSLPDPSEDSFEPAGLPAEDDDS
jgi:hypothetical protein